MQKIARFIKAQYSQKAEANDARKRIADKEGETDDHRFAQCYAKRIFTRNLRPQIEEIAPDQREPKQERNCPVQQVEIKAHHGKDAIKQIASPCLTEPCRNRNKQGDPEDANKKRWCM